MRFWRNDSLEDTVRTGIADVFPRLWRYCLVLTNNKDQADDLAQAACLRALQKSYQFDPGSAFDRWIFRLTQRLWIDEIRKIAVRKGGGLAPIDEVELLDIKPSPEQNLLHKEVLLSIMQLPEAQRATVVLVYVEGNSYRETAEILEIPVGTVMSRLSIARRKISETFQDRAEMRW